MATTANWQFELQGLLCGATTAYRLRREMIGGLGEPEPKTVIVDLEHGDGVYFGPSRKASRAVTLPVIILGSSQSDAMTKLAAFRTAFTDPGTDVTLEIQLPGMHVTMSGRPRGVTADLAELLHGEINVIGSFLATSSAMATV
jgi:hypothetical protein